MTLIVVLPVRGVERAFVGRAADAQPSHRLRDQEVTLRYVDHLNGPAPRRHRHLEPLRPQVRHDSGRSGVRPRIVRWAGTEGGALVDVACTEDDLVCTAQAGCTTAFARLWELLAPAVAAYVRNRGVASPDDVTSEVFLAAFARIGDFQGDGAQFRRFLFTLAHHKAVDDIRRRFGPGIPRQALGTAEQDLPSSPSAEDVALHGELTPRIAALVTALPSTQREVLLLRVVAGLDLSDVAAIVGRSEGAVKQLQHRALRSMRIQLTDVDDVNDQNLDVLDTLADSPATHTPHATPELVEFIEHPTEPPSTS